MITPPDNPAAGRRQAPGDQPPKGLYRRLRRAIARRAPRLQALYRASEAAYYAWLARRRYERRLRLEARRQAAPRHRFPTVRWLAGLAGAIRRRRREPRLTVGVDVTPFWEPLAGIGWYLYRLLEQLADHPEVRIRLYGPSVVATPERRAPSVALPRGSAVEEVLYEVPDGLLISRGRLLGWLARAERLLIALDGNDVLFAPNFLLPPRLELARGALVATIHDLGLHKVPWTLRRRTRRELASGLEQTALRAARLITVSAAVRDELTEHGYAARERVRVVHHGAGQLEGVEPKPPPADLPTRYGLHVGTLEPRKNIDRLLEAWRRLGSLMDAPPLLVLCGGYGWHTGAIRRRVQAAQAAGIVRHLGYVDRGVLAGLYRGAQVVVFPSLYEGFGLPAIEALAAGTPLVCSDIPALREVAGDAALYAPADRPALLAAALHAVLTDRAVRARLQRAGVERRAAFDWADAARRTLDVWREAAGRSG